jgi:hypothetical protein
MHGWKSGRMEGWKNGRVEGLPELSRMNSSSRRVNPKTETDLTTDYPDYRDTIGDDYRCPEVLLQKIRWLIPDNFLKICDAQ